MVTLMFPTIVRNWTVFVLLFASSLNSKLTVRSENKLPLVINTWAFVEANEAAWSVLHQSTESDGALDALVEGCTTCERLQCDGTVGYGGSPDENGETTLDAMIIDGTTMNIGAVANLRQIKDAIKVARHVLENTLHTLLVGEAASDFAESMGFQRQPLSTSNSREIWHNWIKSNCQPNYWYNVQPDPKQSCGPYTPNFQTFRNQLGDREPYEFGRWNHDTIGMIVIDKNAKIFAGTSTNGARYKIPGRVGDSPIPGAGAYADNDVGAAVATGDGDVMMRFLPSLLAVEFLRIGQTPAQAAHDAMQRIVRFYPNFSGALVVVDKFGNYSADCVGMKSFPYSLAFGDAMQKSEVKHVQCTIQNVFKNRVELK